MDILNTFRMCITKEEILKKLIFEKGDIEEAAKRCYELGFMDYAKDFYVLSQQKKYIKKIQGEINISSFLS